MSESKEEERLLRAVTKGKTSNIPSARVSRYIPSDRSSSFLQTRTEEIHTPSSVISKAKDILDYILETVKELKLREEELVKGLAERERALQELSAELTAQESKPSNPLNSDDLDSLLDDVAANLSLDRFNYEKESELRKQEEQRQQEARRQEQEQEQRRKKEEEQKKEEEKRKEEEKTRKQKEQEARKLEEAQRKEREKEEFERQKKEEEDKRKQMEDTVKKNIKLHTEPKAIPEPIPEEAKEGEEARLLRAIKSRGKSFRKSEIIKSEINSPQAAPVTSAKSEEKPNKQAWKDKREQMEAERKIKAAEAEEKKKREQEAKRLQEEEQRKAAEDHHKSIIERGGILKTFVCDGLYDFDAKVAICGSLTGSKEIPVLLDAESMEFKINLPVPPGLHFYRFKVDGRWVVDKKKPTGVDPSISELANKIEI